MLDTAGLAALQLCNGRGKLLSIFKFSKRPLPATPGVENYTLLQTFGLPPIYYIGAGMPTEKDFRATTKAGQVYHHKNVIVDGMEGVSIETMESTPLIKSVDDYISNVTGARK